MCDWRLMLYLLACTITCMPDIAFGIYLLHYDACTFTCMPDIAYDYMIPFLYYCMCMMNRDACVAMWQDILWQAGGCTYLVNLAIGV